MLLCAIQKLQGHMTPFHNAWVTVVCLLFHSSATILKPWCSIFAACFNIYGYQTSTHSPFLKASHLSLSLSVSLSLPHSVSETHPPARTYVQPSKPTCTCHLFWISQNDSCLREQCSGWGNSRTQQPGALIKAKHQCEISFKTQRTHSTSN